MENTQNLKGSAIVMILPYCQSKGVDRFACAQAGCAECTEALLKENIGLIWMVMLQQAIGKTEYADLAQEGRIALWQAIRHYDPGLGYAFSTYACAAIRHRMWLIVRRSLRARGWQAREDERGILEQIIAAWQERQIREALKEGMESLPERMRRVITCYYGLDGNVPQSLAEVGESLGLSHEGVRRLRNNALLLLRMPLTSVRLRSICERRSRAAYREALRQNRDWQRQRRGRK